MITLAGNAEEVLNNLNASEETVVDIQEREVEDRVVVVQGVQEVTRVVSSTGQLDNGYRYYNLGRVTPLFKGDYDPDHIYEPHDIVLFEGNLCVALDDIIGVAPTLQDNDKNWAIVLPAISVESLNMEEIVTALINYITEHGLIVGTQGADGAQGSQGIQGIQGIRGTDGRDGIDGAQGIQGIRGTDGRDGQDGQPGTQGADGAPGSQGIQGIQGIRGTDGRDGQDGQPGTQGADGAQGSQGIQGVQGPAGESSSGGGAQADWNETDPESPSYILNKPHGTIMETIEIGENRVLKSQAKNLIPDNAVLAQKVWNASYIGTSTMRLNSIFDDYTEFYPCAGYGCYIDLYYYVSNGDKLSFRYPSHGDSYDLASQQPITSMVEYLGVKRCPSSINGNQYSGISVNTTNYGVFRLRATLNNSAYSYCLALLPSVPKYVVIHIAQNNAWCYLPFNNENMISYLSVDSPASAWTNNLKIVGVMGTKSQLCLYENSTDGFTTKDVGTLLYIPRLYESNNNKWNTTDFKYLYANEGYNTVEDRYVPTNFIIGKPISSRAATDLWRILNRNPANSAYDANVYVPSKYAEMCYKNILQRNPVVPHIKNLYAYDQASISYGELNTEQIPVSDFIAS